MRNKKIIKSFIAIFVMVMAFSFVSLTAEAATKTKKLTLYVGEKIQYTYYGLGTMKSVSSSKKSVVAASKKSGRAIISAKKKGSAQVTVKGTRGTFIYKITVKSKPVINVSLEPRADGYVNVKVQNKSSVYFDSITVKLTYRDASGNIVDSSNTYIHYLGAKKTACDDDYPFSSSGIDLSKTTYEIEYDRDFGGDYKQSDYTKNVKYSASLNNGYLNLKTSISYKKNADVYAGYTIYFYDAAGNLVGVRDGYSYLSGSKKKYRTDTTKIYAPSDAVSYNIVKRAVMKKR